MLAESRFLARHDCPYCLGSGELNLSHLICRCVYRAVFRAVWELYEEVRVGDRRQSQVYHHESYGCSRPYEEFLADVEIVGRRAMINGRYLAIFERWFIGGFMDLDMRRLMREFDLDEMKFYRDADRIRQVLGKAFISTQPHSLFPTHLYLHEHHARDNSPLPVSTRYGQPLRPPLKPRSIEQSQLPNRGNKAA